MDQIALSYPEYQNKKRKTRREIFLERMDKLVPWKQLEKNDLMLRECSTPALQRKMRANTE